MTDTTATATQPSQDAPPDDRGKIHQADILVHLLVTLLVPMFLEAAGGELYYARMAALETVTAYRARTQADLIAIAQIVAFGLAAVASLSLSLADEMPVTMALRLRGNANGLSRSAEQNRRALAKSQADRTVANMLAMADLPGPQDAADQIDPDYEAAAIARVADAQRVVAEAQARLRTQGAAPGGRLHPGAHSGPHPGANPAPSGGPRRDDRHQAAGAVGRGDDPCRRRVHRQHPASPALAAQAGLVPRRGAEQLCHRPDRRIDPAAPVSRRPRRDHAAAPGRHRCRGNRRSAHRLRGLTGAGRDRRKLPCGADALSRSAAAFYPAQSNDAEPPRRLGTVQPDPASPDDARRHKRRPVKDTAMTELPSRSDRMRAALTQAFAPAVLEIQDDSANHAGHAGAQPGGQTHYSVLLVSAAFEGVSRVARSRQVHAALAAEFGPAEQGGMHALALILRTPAEHSAQSGR
jgi:BolA protein